MGMFNPLHPGCLFTEYIEDNNIGLRVLAKELCVSASALSKIASVKAAVSPEMAVRLEAGLGIAARLWLSMQAVCDLHKARANTDISGVHLHPGVLAAPPEERPGK
ncbi:addiction module HigA family antidote [Pantoea dispersa]|uniref:HigA family addiction module antitoxin n=1 Tax=Pantoea dispersa TaxID=59814 RepID=UPI003D25F077